MRITTDIKRADLIKFNLAFAPRSGFTHALFAALTVGYFIYWRWRWPPEGMPDWLLLGGLAMFSAALAIAIMTLIGIVIILLSTRAGGGVLGKHEYELAPEGLHERTDVNVQLSKWNGIHAIRRAGSYLVIQPTPQLAHLIPKRAFQSEEDFNAFVAQVESYFKASRSVR